MHQTNQTYNAMTQFSTDLFQSHLNETFTVLVEGHDPISLTLTEVVDRINNEQQTSFSLYFQGPPHLQLNQSTFSVNHEKIGELLLFLVPIAKTEEYLQYESVFSTIKTVAQPS